MDLRGAGTLITRLMAMDAASRAFTWAKRSMWAGTLGMITSGSFMQSPKPVVRSMSRVRRTGPRVRHALDIGRPPAIPGRQRPGGDDAAAAAPDLCRRTLNLPLPLPLSLALSLSLVPCLRLCLGHGHGDPASPFGLRRDTWRRATKRPPGMGGRSEPSSTELPTSRMPGFPVWTPSRRRPPRSFPGTGHRHRPAARAPPLRPARSPCDGSAARRYPPGSSGRRSRSP